MLKIKKTLINVRSLQVDNTLREYIMRIRSLGSQTRSDFSVAIFASGRGNVLYIYKADANENQKLITPEGTMP